MKPTPAKEPIWRTGRLLTGVLLCYFSGAFVWLDRLVSKTFAWKPPLWNDQVQYLNEVYQAYTLGKEGGFWKGLSWAFTNAAAQGGVHDIFGYLVVWLAGPSRSAVLSLNILFFLAFQLSWILVALRRWGVAGTVWVLALSWLWWTPWTLGPGSLVDFRLDFMTACAWGIALAAAVSTQGFHSRWGAVRLGLALGFVVALRFLTVTYVTGVFAVFFLWILCGPECARRLGHLALAGAVSVVLAAPFTLPNWANIRTYYVIGHYSGGESAIRASHLGLLASMGQIWSWVWSVHAGRVLVVLALAGVFLALFRRLLKMVPRVRTSRHVVEFWIPVLSFFLVPFLVLALHLQKSYVVESVLAPSFLAGGLWGWSRLSLARYHLNWVSLGLAFAALAWGVGRVQFEFTQDFENEVRRRELRQAIHLADTLYRDYAAHRTPEVQIGVNRITDSFDAQILRLVCFERHKEWVPFIMALPTGIAAEEDSVVLERLRRCSYFFFTPAATPAGPYPYDAQMSRLTPEVRAYCEATLEPRQKFSYGRRTWEFYAPKSAP